MKVVKVGNYVFSTTETYNTLKEAKEAFMKHFPTATESDVEKAVKPLVNKKNDNVTPTKSKSTESTKGSAKVDSAGTEKS